ncbi:hypothetical protein GF343_03670 [Candidatus Woesearchaeota archaeon]|nr:hypothetical protein [Candidatus Woesearchaeota archaeon]
MIIIRFAEIGIKGKNRAFFEKALIRNIKSCLDKKNIEYKNIERPMGRVLIATDDSCDCLQCVFGIASFSDAVNAGFNMEQVKKAALELAKELNPEKSFRITCQRLDKRFPLTSHEFDVELGAFIQKKTNAKVRMKGFDLNIHAEIINGFVYLFTEKTPGLGGLPIGVEGNVLVLLDGENSLLAGLLMMKRGCRVIPVALKQSDTSLLEKYAFGQRIDLKVIKNISKIEALAKELEAKALVVGDLLDTMKDYPADIPVLRPLVAYVPKEIEEELNGFRQRVC